MLELTQQTADAEDELAPVSPFSWIDRLPATRPQRLLAGANGAGEALWPAPPQPASSKTAAKAQPGSTARRGLVRAGMG